MALGDAQAVAVNYLNKEIPDTLAQKNYLYQLMMKRKKKVSGGVQIQMPLAVNEVLSNGFINGSTDTISLNLNQNFVYGTLDWKYFYAAYAVTQQDITITHDTDEAILDLIKGKMAYATNSAVRTLSSALYSSAATAVNQFNGFADIFASSGTSYAGLNNTTYSSWFYTVDSTSQVVNYTNIAKMMATLSEKIDQSPIDPLINDDYTLDVMLSRAAVMNAYAANVPQIQQRFYDSDTAETGFKFITVNGVKWFADSYAPGSVDGSTADNYLYLLSSNSLHLFYKYWFGEGSPLDIDQMTLPNQPIQTGVKYLSGNLGCTNRRVNGVFKTLVA